MVEFLVILKSGIPGRSCLGSQWFCRYSWLVQPCFSGNCHYSVMGVLRYNLPTAQPLSLVWFLGVSDLREEPDKAQGWPPLSH